MAQQDLNMSKKIHPVISITGSSGAGTATVKNTFEHIFMRSIITSAIIGDHSYQHFPCIEMNARDDKA
jgi:phosphoribulokinase